MLPKLKNHYNSAFEVTQIGEKKNRPISLFTNIRKIIGNWCINRFIRPRSSFLDQKNASTTYSLDLDYISTNNALILIIENIKSYLDLGKYTR